MIQHFNFTMSHSVTQLPNIYCLVFVIIMRHRITKFSSTQSKGVTRPSHCTHSCTLSFFFFLFSFFFFNLCISTAMSNHGLPRVIQSFTSLTILSIQKATSLHQLRLSACQVQHRALHCFIFGNYWITLVFYFIFCYFSLTPPPPKYNLTN